VERLEVADGLGPGAPDRLVARPDGDRGKPVDAGHRQRHLDRVAGQDLWPLDAVARDREPRRAGVPHALGGDLRDEQQATVRSVGLIEIADVPKTEVVEQENDIFEAALPLA